jgi:pectin methylesterase-like acyl-CoA thioesterase
MTAKMATAFLLLTLFLSGCVSHDATAPKAAADPAAMPLSAENVGQVRAAVAKAKAAAPKPDTPDGYVRFARQVYVASCPAGYSPAATTDAALAAAKAGSDAARQYLAIMVYDIQLHSAMEGTSLSADDWRAVYVGSGLMSERAYASYAALARGGKVLP